MTKEMIYRSISSVLAIMYKPGTLFLFKNFMNIIMPLHYQNLTLFGGVHSIRKDWNSENKSAIPILSQPDQLPMSGCRIAIMQTLIGTI